MGSTLCVTMEECIMYLIARPVSKARSHSSSHHPRFQHFRQLLQHLRTQRRQVQSARRRVVVVVQVLDLHAAILPHRVRRIGDAVAKTDAIIWPVRCTQP